MSDLISNVLTNQFNYDLNQCSPVREDLVRVVKKDEKGEEHIVYEPFDYPSYQKSLGLVDNWSLDNLLKAGINPDFGINTGFNTRLEGIGFVDSASAFVEKLVNESNESKESE